ncbi:MAG TPA: S-methyl-5-thioribose-1-phosphate isomerase [Gammaproteobacteria bacterium]|nr:S-methyl-5-thioribose-1-phosphate isomerase [Gammaproteobacteria bacterium]
MTDGKPGVAKLLPATIEWRDDALYLLDQTRLPAAIIIEKQLSVEQVWASIKALKVRGAPAIGVAAAYGLCLAMQPFCDLPATNFLQQLALQAQYLDSARPTAVNLGWALRRMQQCLPTSSSSSAKLYTLLVAEAHKIHVQDRQICQAIGDVGVTLITDGMGILTHCNAGALATTGLGTATAPLYVAHQQGLQFSVYADETRPLLQGARLTSWELHQSGVNVTLITDNTAARMMDEGRIDLVMVGTDRVAANGDVANKIGTLGVAILARYFALPFYVACPSTTIDLATACGNDIPIEERAASEVTHFGQQATAAKSIRVRNPAFDITPAALVTGIITERGIVHPPFDRALQQLFG